MTLGGPGPGPKWSLLGGQHITKALETESEEVLSSLEAALAEFMLDPEAYPGTRLAKGPLSDPRRNLHLVKLPHNFWMGCEIHPEGMPPLGGSLVMVRSLVRLWEDSPATE